MCKINYEGLQGFYLQISLERETEAIYHNQTTPRQVLAKLAKVLVLATI